MYKLLKLHFQNSPKRAAPYSRHLCTIPNNMPYFKATITICKTVNHSPQKKPHKRDLLNLSASTSSTHAAHKKRPRRKAVCQGNRGINVRASKPWNNRKHSAHFYAAKVPLHTETAKNV